MKNTELLKKLLDKTLESYQDLEQEYQESEDLHLYKYDKIKEALGGKYYDFREVIEEIKRLRTLENK